LQRPVWGDFELSNANVNLFDLFESIYSDVPIGIALVSTDGRCLKANPALSGILGCSEADLPGRSFRDFTHPDDLAEENRLFEDAVAGRLVSVQREKRYIRADGSVVWASLYASPVRDPEGRLQYFISHIIDITEEKLAKAKLLEIGESFELIANNARDVIALTAPDGAITFISPSVRELLGYEPEEVVGKTNIELYHPDDVALYAGRELVDNEPLTYRLKHKDGRWIWFETTLRQIRDEQGRVTRTVAIGRDITERKKQEDNLAEAQRIARIGSWEWEPQTGEVRLSRELYHLHGLEPYVKYEEASEMLELVHPDDRKALTEWFARIMDGQTDELEYRQVGADGAVKYLLIRGNVTRDDSGAVVLLQGTVQDITDRKKVEQQLLETVQRYNSLKRYNHDAVISFGLDGRVINANMMASRLTGYPIEELRGRHYADIFEAGSIEQTLRALDYGHGNDNPESEMNRLRNRDGGETEVLTAVAPIIINDQLTGFYIIAKDFTEQKKLILEKEAAENTNKAKSSFFAMMSHEIRTPMNGVIGMADLLMETGLDAEQEEYVNVIRRSGESLIKILNDILDFSKIEFGSAHLAADPFDVRQCLTETVELLYPLARAKQLTLEWTILPEVPGKLVGDCDRLKQVLNNLVGNAIKFTDRGSIGVKIGLAGEDSDRYRLSFAVRDTGIGIPPEKVKYLFEPFSQLDPFMTRNVGGTGLGLAISKKLVELMGGDIRVVQPDGPGTEFVFTAWFGKEDTSGKTGGAAAQTHEASERALRVLIAEDNDINQLVLKRLLEKQGHKSDIAANGLEAVDLALSGGYDMIFMDVHMPEMNGLDAARAIKGSLPPGTCPVIVAVTANASSHDRELCLAAGMDDYLSKPIKGDAVRDVIRRHRPAR